MLYIIDMCFIESVPIFFGLKPFVYFSIHTFRADECVLMYRPWLRLTLRADGLDQVFESKARTHVPFKHIS